MKLRATLGIVLLSLGCTALSTPQAHAGPSWAEKMFETTEHNFGSVARGAKTEFEFKLKNIYVEDVHIESVRSSCGCTTPSIKTEMLKTYETGAIVARRNAEKNS